MLLPYIIMAVIYICWRAYMLEPENIFKGYKLAAGYVAPTFSDMIRLPFGIVRLMRWDHICSGLLSLLHACYFNKLPLMDLRMILAICIILICSIAPILPVSNILSERYLFLISMIFNVFMVTGLQNLFRTLPRSNANKTIILILGLDCFYPVLFLCSPEKLFYQLRIDVGCRRQIFALQQWIQQHIAWKQRPIAMHLKRIHHYEQKYLDCHRTQILHQGRFLWMFRNIPESWYLDICW